MVDRKDARKIAARRAFAEWMLRTKRQAGDPSYHEIYIASGRAVSPSTISRIFNAECDATWRSVTAILLGLGMDLHTITEAKGEWYKLMAVVKPIAAAAAGDTVSAAVPATPTDPMDPASAATPPETGGVSHGPGRRRRHSAWSDNHEPTGYECPKCGVWVVNRDLHDQWHREIDEGVRERRLRLVATA